MLPTSVICWKWTPATDYRSAFGPETVNTLRRMVARHFPHPHRFICCTDDAAGLDSEVLVVPMGDLFVGLQSMHGPRRPSCFRRLRAFAPEAADLFGARFVSLDLDVVITGNLTKLWSRSEDFVIWQGQRPGTAYNASMYLLTAGTRRQVWDTFDPVTSPPIAAAAGCYGSDQAWISYVLGGREATWSKADGVYSFRNDIRRVLGQRLPANARVVFFHGSHDPWGPLAQKVPWVKEHYR